MIAKVQQKYSKNQAFSLYADTDTHTYKTRIKHGTEKAEEQTSAHWIRPLS